MELGKLIHSIFPEATWDIYPDHNDVLIHTHEIGSKLLYEYDLKQGMAAVEKILLSWKKR